MELSYPLRETPAEAFKHQLSQLIKDATNVARAFFKSEDGNEEEEETDVPEPLDEGDAGEEIGNTNPAG